MDILWSSIHDEALLHFRNLLRLNTSNPPGNEIIAVNYLSQILKKEEIPFEVIESGPGRANLIARFSSGGPEGALLLSSHLDVVPAEEGKWKYPPFEAKIEEGYLWGRGTIDMKHMAVYSLMTLLLMKRYGIKIKRDIIWAAVADEEAGCEFGSRYLVENHPDLLWSEYALNELGGFTIHSGTKRFYPIQVAEKGFVWLKIKATGEAGHGSLPHGKSAIVKVAHAVDRLHRHYLPRHGHRIAESFILSLASGRGFPASLFLRAVTKPYGDFFLKFLPDRDAARFFVATLHNTACPTGLEAGQKINVIPSEAALLVDGRILPGKSPESFLKELRQLLGKDFYIEILHQAQGTETSVDTPLFQTLQEVLEERDPGSEAIPYLIAGFTDATNYQKLGIKTYGFSPIKLPPNLVFSKLYHNHNERIPLEGFQWGLETFFEAVKRFCTL